MNKRHFGMGLVMGLAALAVTAWTTPVWASSHREAPAISEDPAADNTDLYAWVNKGSRDKLYIVANWNPLEEPAGGPNFHKFSDNVRYEIHIARGPTDLFDVVTYYIRFQSNRPARTNLNDLTKSGPLKTFSAGDLKSGVVGGHQFFRQLALVEQTYSVWRIDWNGPFGTAKKIVNNKPVAPPNIGPRTQAVVYKGALGLQNADKYDQNFIKSNFIHSTSDGGRVFAGPRDDGFYVDLGGIFDLANVLPGTGNREKPTDGVSGFNVHSIALEIPTKSLTSNGQAPPSSTDKKVRAQHTLGIWASSSRRRITFRGWGGNTFHFGGWVQVSRLGFPLINEAIIGIQDKDRYNASHPAFDVARFGAYFLNPVVVRDAEAVGIYAALGVTNVDQFKFDRLDIVGAINVLNDEIKSIGDVLRVDMTQDPGFPSGRPLTGGKNPNQEQADVTDVILSLVLTKQLTGVSDNVDFNDKDFLTEFPFLPTPHEGFNEGHGTPAKNAAP